MRRNLRQVRRTPSEDAKGLVLFAFQAKKPTRQPSPAQPARAPQKLKQAITITLLKIAGQKNILYL